MNRWRAVAVSLGVVVALATASPIAQRPAAPILVLVSFDGFRWDYLDRGETPHLKALAARGVRAEGLIPSFPSFTFPNHYTIATGLYPEHHGVIANTMDDPRWPERFSMTSLTSREQKWWSGEPIWVTARLQGRRSAAVFWPGSEVAVKGILPDSWLPFDDNMPNVDRVNHALDVLALPESERPSLVTVYFSEVDHVGHDYGPDSPEMAEALRHVDDSLGLLEKGVRNLHLTDRVTFVVVSDHGMASLSDDRVVFLDDFIDLSRVDVVDWGQVVQIRPRNIPLDEAYGALTYWPGAMAPWTRDHLAFLHYDDNPRIQPLVVMAGFGWEITSHARWNDDRARHRKRGGAHGYNPEYPDMHGVFVAAGPRVKKGYVAPRFSNIHVYDFLCGVLGLTPAKNDGDPAVTRAFFAR